jgi:hypothetical protein
MEPCEQGVQRSDELLDELQERRKEVQGLRRWRRSWRR